MLKKWYILCLGIISVFSTAFVFSYDMYCSCCGPSCYGPDCGIFGVRAEYLFWKTQICDLNFAREYLGSLNDLGNNVNGIIDNDDSTHRVSYKWCSGFRVGADYQCSYNDPWKYSLVYTYFRSRDSDTVIRKESETEGEDFFLFPIIPYVSNAAFDVDLCGVSSMVFVNNNSLLDRAKAHTRFRIDLGDFEIIRAMPLCGPACFHVVLGIRGGYISNRWTTNYQIAQDPLTLIDCDVNLINNWRFSTIGPRVGGKFDWCLGYGFSVYLDASLSALWGKMRNRACTQFTASRVCPEEITESVTFTLESQHHRCYKATLMADEQLGVAFNWDGGCFVVQGKVGVEFVHFNALSDDIFYTFPTGLSSGKEYKNGNIDLYGLTAGLSVLF